MPYSSLVLASASPRRRELLAQIGITCRIVPADIDEIPHARETPRDYVQRIAAEKSAAAQKILDAETIILAADTEVILDDKVFGKPADRDTGIAMLEALSGKTHQVMSAVSLRQGKKHWQALQISNVSFRTLTSEEMEAYWDTGEAHGKAGGYAVQGYGALFVRHIEGSFSGIVGLPLHETAELLRQAGLTLIGQKTT